MMRSNQTFAKILTAVIPPTMAMNTEAIAEMTELMAPPMAEKIEPCWVLRVSDILEGFGYCNVP